MNAFSEDTPLPDHVSLLIPAQRAVVAAKRNAPPTNSFEALLRASAPQEGDPPVPLVDDAPAPLQPLVMQSDEPLPEGLSLLTPGQRAEVAARRAGGAA